MALALDETISLQQEAAHQLRKCFRTFRNSRFSVLARELAALVQDDAEPVAYAVDERTKSIGAPSAVQYFPNLGIMLGRWIVPASRRSKKTRRRSARFSPARPEPDPAF